MLNRLLQNNLLCRAVIFFVLLGFLTNTLMGSKPAFAQIANSKPYLPVTMSGMTVHPEDPLRFDFIIETGDDHLTGEIFKAEAQKVIDYFMATLTVPENEMWVNLSPFEKNRIIADGLSKTALGRDMLEQDYLLKQTTASLLSPETAFGKTFWANSANAQKASAIAGKVWIVPENATVYVHQHNVLVTQSHLKVRMESDDKGEPKAHSDEEKMFRDVLLPQIEKEVNESKTFANLRQIYNAMILATWYKKKLQKSILSNLYLNQNKTNGIEIADKTVKEKIYQQYLNAFKQGAFQGVKEEYNEETGEYLPKKYFAGGIDRVQMVNESAVFSKSWNGSNKVIVKVAASALVNGDPDQMESLEDVVRLMLLEDQIALNLNSMRTLFWVIRSLAFPIPDDNLNVEALWNSQATQFEIGMPQRFKNRASSEEWLQSVIKRVQAYAKDHDIKEAYESSTLQNYLYPLVQNGTFKTSREIRLHLVDVPDVILASGWTTDGVTVQGINIDTKESVQYTWKAVLGVKEAHKKYTIVEWLDKEARETGKPFDFNNFFGIHFSPQAWLLFLENFNILKFNMNFYGQLGGPTEQNAIFNLLKKQLQKDNPGKEIGNKALISYFEQFNQKITPASRDRLLTPESYLLGMLRDRSKTVQVHSLDDVVTTYDPSQVWELSSEDIAFLSGQIEQIKTQAQRIGDTRMAEYLNQFQDPRQYHKFRAMIDPFVEGRAVLAPGQEAGIIIHDILLQLAKLGFPGLETKLQMVLIHEFQHALDHEDQRLPPGADADLWERSAIIRTAAYFKGDIKTQGRRFVAFYGNANKMTGMYSTKDSQMPAKPEEYKTPDKDVRYSHYETEVYKPFPVKALGEEIQNGQINPQQQPVQVHSTAFDKVRLQAGWSYDPLRWIIKGKNENSQELEFSWKDVLAYQIADRPWVPEQDLVQTASSSIANPGGIDLNAGKLNLAEQGPDQNFIFSFDLYKNLNSQNLSGIRPVIINMAPLNNFSSFVGASPLRQ